MPSAAPAIQAKLLSACADFEESDTESSSSLGSGWSGPSSAGPMLGEVRPRAGMEVVVRTLMAVALRTSLPCRRCCCMLGYLPSRAVSTAAHLAQLTLPAQVCEECPFLQRPAQRRNSTEAEVRRPT